MTVEELAKILQDLIADGKGDYTVNLDGYNDIDVEVQDYSKSIRLW